MKPFYAKLLARYEKVENGLCVGLDPDLSKLPSGYSQSLAGIEEFLKHIIDVTGEVCLAYKPNISFFEGLGIDGLKVLERVCKSIPTQIPIVLDAKRGDISNTSAMQARFIFDYFGADATTIHPYMGIDSVSPFLDYKDRFSFVLGLTSNPSSRDFQLQQMSSGELLYETVLKKVLNWNAKYQNVGLVVGATQADLSKIRLKAENLLFLIPGVGVQGGNYQQAFNSGKNGDGISLVNVSRKILYCSKTKDALTQTVRETINSLIKTKNF